MKAFEIDASLACKLASVVVHADELFSPDGRMVFDGAVLLTVARDPEVQEWVLSLGPLAPVKRVKSVTRALLMVQTGDGRPKCLGVCSLDGLAAGKWRAHREESDHWWIVEAENADAARAAIECYEGGTGCTSGRVFGFNACRSGRHPGRVLAYGGRS